MSGFENGEHVAGRAVQPLRQQMLRPVIVHIDDRRSHGNTSGHPKGDGYRAQPEDDSAEARGIAALCHTTTLGPFDLPQGAGPLRLGHQGEHGPTRCTYPQRKLHPTRLSIPRGHRHVRLRTDGNDLLPTRPALRE